ncbi:uncharacterized protein [Amphiura filiformis]|uniref:uncharacterized protein n=1 Tax=Amphiura filiformis TaxID=82378 RepID=UPI003B216737
MPIGNSRSTSSIASAAVSNSPCQMVPCSPYIGTITCQKSPAPMVPNVRRLIRTPDIGHLVPQTPDVVDHNNLGLNSWRRPTSQRSSMSHGEQLVPQTPTSSNPTARDSNNTHYTPSTTPKRSTNRERRNLPDTAANEDIEQLQESNSQLDLFRGDDIFG